MIGSPYSAISATPAGSSHYWQLSQLLSVCEGLYPLSGVVTVTLLRTH